MMTRTEMDSEPFVFIRRRENTRSNEMRKKPHEPTKVVAQYGDRFIPRRYALPLNNQNLKFGKPLKQLDMFTQPPSYYWSQQHMQKVCQKGFDVKERRILQLSDPFVAGVHMPVEVPECDREVQDWPCKPRTRPFAYKQSSHDLPGLTLDFERNLTDWSASEHIVASVFDETIIWDHQRDVTFIYRTQNLQSLAFSPTGRYLAISNIIGNIPVLELWQLQYKASTDFANIRNKDFAEPKGIVHCVEWSKNETEIVCGLETGHIVILTVPELDEIHKQKRFNSPITMIKFSPTMRFLAFSNANGTVFIYNWMTLEEHTTVRSTNNLHVCFDWHPWNGTDLVITEDRPASIVIMDVPSESFVALFQRKDNIVRINDVSFNKLTGELLVSVSEKKSNGLYIHKILVLAGLVHVVDVIESPGGIRFMSWSPDGTRLTAAENEETLTVWKFHPGKKGKKKIPTLREKFDFRCNNIDLQSLLRLPFGKEFKKYSCIR